MIMHAPMTDEVTDRRVSLAIAARHWLRSRPFGSLDDPAALLVEEFPGLRTFCDDAMVQAVTVRSRGGDGWLAWLESTPPGVLPRTGRVTRALLGEPGERAAKLIRGRLLDKTRASRLEALRRQARRAVEREWKATETGRLTARTSRFPRYDPSRPAHEDPWLLDLYESTRRR